MLTRIIAFLFLALIGYFMPAPVFLAAAALYIAWWSGYELLVIAAFIDAQFGQGGAFFGYFYTLVVGVFLILAVLLKPRLRFYNLK